MSLLNNLIHTCRIQRRRAVEGTTIDARRVPVVEQTGVKCWEQQASASEISEFDKRGIRISRKIYFATDPGVGEGHEIVIESRLGVAIPVANQLILDVKSTTRPDASAGFGRLWRIMADEQTGANR